MNDKSIRKLITVLIILNIILIGLLISDKFVDPVYAQTASVGRYQISSWKGDTADYYGFYVIDTKTGEVKSIRHTNQYKW